MAEEEHSSIPLELTVVDVYKWAAEIGQEFERLIDTFGADSVTELMPKVVRVLEQLEKLVDRDEKEHNEVSELRLDVQRLQAMYLEKSEHNIRIQKDLEQVDESWKEEAKELLQTISRLREENKQLNTALSSYTKGQHAQAKEISDSDFEVMARLKETVDRQRDTLRAKDMEINQRNMELEALQSQVERLAKVNHDLRRKQAITQQQGKSLVEEKAHLQASLQGKEQEITALKDRLGLKGDLGDQIIKRGAVEADKNPWSWAGAGVRTHDLPSTSFIIRHSNHLAKRSRLETGSVASAKEEMMDSLEALRTEDSDRSHGKEDSSDMTQPADTSHMDGKLVIDLSDPDRPRFTMTELRSVLQEKNELKIRLMEVEDELSKYKNKLTKSTQTLPGEVYPETNTVWTQTYNPVEDPFMESSVDNRDSDPDRDSCRSSEGSLYFDSDHFSLMRDPESEEETDAPVPDVPEPTAQQTQQESGIKKLFSFFSRSKSSPPSTDSSHQPTPDPLPSASEGDNDTFDQSEEKNDNIQEHTEEDQEVDKAEEASESVETDGKVPEMLLCSGV
ncbi:protein transport from ciliary membrane to plasma membrane [Branchiostoma belcheri]|nr:protein transport from ciliary membrane to plasma membrane [Branchiostoma belcheri]